MASFRTEKKAQELGLRLRAGKQEEAQANSVGLLRAIIYLRNQTLLSYCAAHSCYICIERISCLLLSNPLISKSVGQRNNLHFLQHIIGPYIASKPYNILTHPNSEDELEIIREPPPDIAIISGEIIYQLRSALDYLAFDLVKRNHTGTPLPKTWEKRCCFPLWFDPPVKPAAYNCFEREMPNISKAAFAFVERVQPYHGRGDVVNALSVIGKLSNIDKHRHLNVTLANVEHHEILTTSHGTISHRRSGLKHGAKINFRVPKQPYPTVDMKRSYTVYITFDEPTVGKSATLEVQEVLQFCIEQVKSNLIPAFVHFLK